MVILDFLIENKFSRGLSPSIIYFRIGCFYYWIDISFGTFPLFRVRWFSRLSPREKDNNTKDSPLGPHEKKNNKNRM